MADADLPVFSFRANWREPMAERLAFLTDVLAASEGAEQRRSIRQTPRRTFEADFLLTGRERTFWDLFINSLGGAEVVAPLYWEIVTLPATLTATVSDRIDFDTTYREWAYHAGYLALLIGDSALDYEVVEIASVDAAGVDLTLPPARSWPKGSKLLPLRRAVLDQVGDVNQPSAAVGTVTAQIRIVGPNPWTPAADASPVYSGLPVFLSEPNWVENLTVQQDREIALLDTDVGLTYQVDASGRVLLGQAHRWFLPGREKLAGFRDLIYRHRGRAGAFWLPTFKADLRLVNSPGSGATQIEVENVGYLYTGGPTSGREYIAIKHTGGTILRKVLSVIPGTTSATEKLNLDAALGLALSPGQVLRISFADAARFDTDEFEIVHYGGVDAHHDASALFRTFKNTRTSPTPIYYPAPVGTMNSVPCGEGTVGIINIDASVHGGATATIMAANGVTVTGFSPGQTISVSQPPGQTYSGWSPWGDPSPINSGSSGSKNNFWVIPDNNPALAFEVGAGTLYDGYEAARAAFGSQSFGGYSTYTFGIIDTPIGDNSGGLSLLLEVS